MDDPPQATDGQRAQAFADEAVRRTGGGPMSAEEARADMDREVTATRARVFREPRFGRAESMAQWRAKLAALLAVQPSQIDQWVLDDFVMNVKGWHSMVTGTKRLAGGVPASECEEPPAKP